MSILNDKEIETLCDPICGVSDTFDDQQGPMITPFIGSQVSRQGTKKVISFGLSSSGYDVRLGHDFLFPTSHPDWGPHDTPHIDPKNFDPRIFESLRCERVCHLPAHGFCLGTTLEHFNIPDNIVAFCTGKSTYARCGILITPTPFEPGWRGQATLEISNTTDYPAILYPGEGIVQVMFHKLNMRPITTYADRSGKYQDQKGVTPAKM